LEINPALLLHQIEKAKAGNQAAFKYLLDTFWVDVYAFSLSIPEMNMMLKTLQFKLFQRPSTNFIHSTKNTPSKPG